MVERDRKGNVVDLAVPAFLPDCKPVVEDVVMGQSGGFGPTCGSRSELDISGVVVVDVAGKKGPACRLGDIGVVNEPFEDVVGGVHPDDSLERGEFVGL